MSGDAPENAKDLPASSDDLEARDLPANKPANSKRALARSAREKLQSSPKVIQELAEAAADMRGRPARAVVGGVVGVLLSIVIVPLLITAHPGLAVLAAFGFIFAGAILGANMKVFDNMLTTPEQIRHEHELAAVQRQNELAEARAQPLQKLLDDPSLSDAERDRIQRHRVDHAILLHDPSNLPTPRELPEQPPSEPPVLPASVTQLPESPATAKPDGPKQLQPPE